MCIQFTFYVVDKTSYCKCVASWLSYQPFDFINIGNLMSLVIEVAEPETSYFGCITDIEMIWACVGYFPPLVDWLVWETPIETKRLHLLSIISSF